MKFTELSAKLRRLGVPEGEIARLRPMFANLRRATTAYERLKDFPILPIDLSLGQTKRRLKHLEEEVSSHVIALLKLHTGKRVLVVWGSARVTEDDPDYQLVVDVV